MSRHRLVRERGGVELEVLGAAAAAVWRALTVAVLGHCGRSFKIDGGRECAIRVM